MNDLSPQTSLLDTLAGFFARALGRTTFPLSADFFAAGGDSLGAAEVLHQVDATYRIELRFRDILEAPTPLQLSLAILRARARAAGHDLATELATLSSEDTSRMLAYLQATQT